MRKFITIALLSLVLAGAAFAKDHSNDYQAGTFISATAVADGTITDTLHGDGTTIAGNVYANHVGVYRIKVADGTWFVTTLSQTQDSMLRGMGMTPEHFKSEKANPLDGLKNGDKVLFRLHDRRYLNGKFTLMAIPYADNPNKEVEFSTRFESDVAPSKPEKPTDNVKAMCDAHKLSAELEKLLCVAPTPATSTEESTTAAPPVANTEVAVQTSVLTNQSVVDMVKAGLSDGAIIGRIQASKTHFDVSSAATAKLMQDAPGISMGVIKAMVLSWMKR
jgi:hypothetical protein